MDQNQTNVCASGDGCSDGLTYYAGKGVEVSSATITQKPGHPMKECDSFSLWICWEVEFLRNRKLSREKESSLRRREEKRGV
ncbi:unnamed protein product [Prunus armeniaca]|uniref:Uncharacterized protein n=1 Tax=Prunus armeniaca TaxID=36596 RepID=A0A6J5TQZ7_PRUAR|nr:unnamed protein product [Prunus armeniaca]CAB4295485.1 unnamed protein product [Prunus armeniaca]